MADNVLVDNGAETDYTVSSDEAASGQVQRVKLTTSGDGEDTHIPADAANGLDVDVTRVSGTVTVDGSGVTQPVSDAGGSLTVDDGGVTISIDDGGGAITVDGTVAATLSEPISVDDNGGSLTVDGTVTVQDGGSTISVDDGGASLTVDGSVTVGSLANSTTQGDITAQDEVVSLSPGGRPGVGVDISGTWSGTLIFEGSADAGTTWVTIKALNTDTLALIETTTGNGIWLLPVGGFTTIRVRASAWTSGTATVKINAGYGPGVVYVVPPASTPVDDGGSTLSIDDGGGAITVDGTVAATLTEPISVDDNGSTLSVDDGGASLTVDVGTALPAGTNAIGKLAANSGVDIGDVDVTSVAPGSGATNLGKAEDAAHSSGDTGVYALAVRDDSLAAHSGTDGDYESLHTDADGALWVTVKPSANTGLSIFRTLDADETEEDVKTSAGKLYGWYIYNDGAAEVYVKFYNATAANTTVGTTTPILTIPIPAGSAANVEFTNGIAFGTALCIAATTGVADNDTTAPAANQVVANIFYK